MGDVWKETKAAAGSIVDSVGDIGEGAVKAAGGVVNVVTETVSGGSTSDALKEVGQGVNKIAAAQANIATSGQGAKLDAVSGGLYSATVNATKFGGDLLEGKSVRDNLKDTARVGAVAGATIYGGPTAGMAVNSGLSKDGKTNLSLKSIITSAGNVVGGTVGNILKQIGYEGPTMSGNPQSGYYSDSPTSIYQGEGKSSYLLPVIIGIILVTVVVVIKKKKK